MGFGSSGDGFAIGTFSAGEQRAFAGIVRDDRVWSIADLPGSEGVTSTIDLLDRWDALEPRLAAAARGLDPARARPLAELSIAAPIVPRQIFCTGANYRKHVIELTLKQPDPSAEGMTAEERGASVAAMMDARAASGTPYAFVKLPSAVTGPFDEIVLPAGVNEPDWELELGVVIGRKARNVGRGDALAHVAGYVVVNDITARDRIYRADMKAIGTDWLAAKNAATFLPTGPFIVPARFVAEPQDLRIVLTLNGETMQDESTADMIFDIGRQIEYISSLVTLLPGDIVCTGSPAGNGTHYGRFLQPGDVVEGSITGLGSQRLRCVAE